MQVDPSVFKAYDIRGVVGRSIDEAFAEHLGRAFGSEAVAAGERALAIEAEILATLAELKPDRPLPSNVEFYAGVVMDRCGLPRDLFTPTFASSREIGWCANILEQAADNRIIRPSARYVGPPPPQPVPEAEA